MRFIALTAFLFTLSTRVLAAPVEWTLTNIEFLSPGGYLPVTGSFTFDADTLAVTDVSLSYYLADHFLYGVDVSGNGSMIVFTTAAVATVTDLDNYTGAAMVLGFTSALTNAGGERFLVQAPEAPPTSLNLLDNPSQVLGCSAGIDNCGYPLGVYFTPTGSVVASVVPIPAAAWLFGSALVGLGWLKRKQPD